MLNFKKRKHWLSVGGVVALGWLQHSVYAAEAVDYNSIIELARQGAHGQAIEDLRSWQKAHPNDQRVGSDMVVVMAWAGQDAAALESAKSTGLTALAPYALRSAAKSARNQQDHAWALRAYAHLQSQDQQDCDALLGIANSQVDLKQSELANQALEKLELSCAGAAGTWPERIAQARTYWASHLKSTQASDVVALGWWTENLSLTELASTQPAVYVGAQRREAVMLASRTGSHNLASMWLPQAQSSMSADDRASVLSASAAQKIRWALTTPDQERAKWDELLAMALGQLKEAMQLAKEPRLVRSIISDTMAVYAERGDDAQTLQLMREADRAGIRLLPHALLAASDALMRDSQPALAEKRLQLALSQLPGSGEFDRRDLNITMFYALLDQGKYQEARLWIDRNAAQVPAFANKGLVGVETQDSGYVRFQLARALLVSSAQDAREYERSQSLKNDLLRTAPFNTTVRLDEAEWLQARGWSRASADANSLVLADQPDNTRALSMAARQALDNGDFERYASARDEMQRLGAHPVQLKRLQDAADLQMGFILSGDISRGSSNSSASESGSSDGEYGFSLLSPVYQNRWRIKARWRNSYAQFNTFEPKTQFAALGARSYWPYLWVDVELTKRLDPTAPVGLRLASQWQVADGVSLFASAATRSEELPLRGQAAGESARSMQVSLDWRALAQTYLGINAGAVKSTDGNTRVDLAGYVDQAYTLSDSWRANARLDLGRSTNTASNVAYYSPQRLTSFSATAGLTQAIVTAGQRSWTHKLALSLGQIAQQNYATGDSYGVSYEHEWRLPAARSFTVAVGQSRRPYDGVQDRRRTFTLRWSTPL